MTSFAISIWSMFLLGRPYYYIAIARMKRVGRTREQIIRSFNREAWMIIGIYIALFLFGILALYPVVGYLLTGLMIALASRIAGIDYIAKYDKQ